MLDLIVYLILALASLGWLMSLSPRTAGRIYLLVVLNTILFGLSTAVLSFGIGGVGVPFPGWQQVLQLGKLVFYATAFFSLIALYVSPVSVSWRTWYGLIIYGVSLLIAGAAATNPGLTDISPYVLLGLIGAVSTSYCNTIYIIRVIRMMLIGLCFGSLLYLIFDFAGATSNPDASYLNLEPYSNSFGIPFRLHGLTPHGVNLSLVSAIALLLGLYRPVKFKWEWLWQGSALICLILSQGKSAWIVTGVSLSVLGIYRAREMPITVRRVLHLVLTLIIGVSVAASIAYAPQINPEAWTFTGRTTVWKITVEEFYKNPIAGYGPSLWDTEFRTAYNLPWVGQAHNQYLQTIGQAGLIGAMGLATFIWFFISQAWNARHMTDGLSLALASAFLVRGLSESNLRYGTDVGGLIIFVTLLLISSPPKLRSK